MTDLLNLPCLRVTDYEDCGDHYFVAAHGHLEPGPCSGCGHDDYYRHGAQKQIIMDTPIHGKRTMIEVHRRRFRCKICGKTAFEPMPDIDPKRQATKRLVDYIEHRCLTETFMSVAREVGVDNKTVRNIFDDMLARKEKQHKYQTPEVLGIDELKIIGDYRAMLTNIKELALFDMLPSRKKANLIDYFRNLPDKGKVTTLVMDMWNPYRQLGVQELPGRLIVVDKFHVLRMANEGLERVRKRIRKGLDQKTRLKLKNERFVLLKRKSALSEDEKKDARKWFSLFPELGCAYDAKERFFEIYDQPTRAAAEIVAGRWADSLPTDIAKDFRDLQVALGNWNKEIFNYYENPVTNAYTEALNGIARQINRMGRGYSFEVLRARLLFEKQAIKKSPSLRKKPRQRPVSGYEFIQEFKRGLEGPAEEPVVEYGADLLKLIQLFEDGYFS